LILSETPDPPPDQVLATASVEADFTSKNDARGDPLTLELDKPIPVKRGSQYYLHLETDAGTLFINARLSPTKQITITDFPSALTATMPSAAFIAAT